LPPKQQAAEFKKESSSDDGTGINIETSSLEDLIPAAARTPAQSAQATAATEKKSDKKSEDKKPAAEPKKDQKSTISVVEKKLMANVNTKQNKSQEKGTKLAQKEHRRHKKTKKVHRHKKHHNQE